MIIKAYKCNECNATYDTLLHDKAAREQNCTQCPSTKPLSFVSEKCFKECDCGGCEVGGERFVRKEVLK